MAISIVTLKCIANMGMFFVVNLLWIFWMRKLVMGIDPL
jgi:hypothetical protein